MPNLFNKAIKASSMPSMLADWINECYVPVYKMFFYRAKCHMETTEVKMDYLLLILEIQQEVRTRSILQNGYTDYRVVKYRFETTCVLLLTF